MPVAKLSQPAATAVVQCSRVVEEVCQSRVGNREGDIAMKKLLLAGVAFFALTAGGPASAADVPVRPVYKAPPVTAAVAPFNWSRCYVGAHGGYGWGRNTNDFGTAIASGPTESFEAFPAEF